MSKSDLFDLLGVCLLALFAFAIWPYLALGVMGAAFLVASWATGPVPQGNEGSS